MTSRVYFGTLINLGGQEAIDTLKLMSVSTLDGTINVQTDVGTFILAQDIFVQKKFAVGSPRAPMLCAVLYPDMRTN